MPFNATSGKRLKEERNRVGLTQQALADLLGTRREIFSRYENGQVVPGGDVFERLATAGIDIAYVLTGDRSFEPGPSLTPEEQVMLDYYRAASRDVRKAALGALIGGAAPGKTKVGQVFHGNVGQAIEGNVDQRGVTIGVFRKNKK